MGNRNVFIGLLGVLFMVHFVLGADDGEIISTPLGKLRGKIYESYGYRNYTAFWGVPFAEPPIGDLRFKEPVAKKPWTGIWEANNNPICTQIIRDAAGDIFQGDEDCLYLNIFVPTEKPCKVAKKLPVLVHIHAGAWMFGYGKDYAGPGYIMDRDIIFITLNYRLGPLGFLSTQDMVVPGNNGLRDQVMALKWIKNYISYFGGDPKQVTISGLSAGGASVQYHYLSPLSKGLFKNGISNSGSALMPWALQDKPLLKARMLAKEVGCLYTNNAQLVKCLKERPAKQIVQATAIFYPWNGNPFSPFGPVPEPFNPKAFLPKHPYKLLVEGRVADLPWMNTVTTDEGLYPAAGFLNMPEILPDLEKNWDKACPGVFDFEYTASVSRHAAICKDIKDFYMEGKPISNETFLPLVAAMSERMFDMDAAKSSILQAKVTKSPNWFYEYNYIPNSQPSFAALFSSAPQQGVCHGDDVNMIFSNKLRPLRPYSKLDERMKDILLDWVESFMKYGSPISGEIEWEPLEQKEGDFKLLRINSPDDIFMKTVNNFGNASFWEGLNLSENEHLF